MKQYTAALLLGLLLVATTAMAKDLGIEQVIALISHVPESDYRGASDEEYAYIAKHFKKDMLRSLFVVVEAADYKEHSGMAWWSIGVIGALEPGAVSAKQLTETIERVAAQQSYRERFPTYMTGYSALARCGGSAAADYLLKRAVLSGWKSEVPPPGDPGLPTPELLLLYRRAAITALGLTAAPKIHDILLRLKESKDLVEPEIQAAVDVALDSLESEKNFKAKAAAARLKLLKP